MEQRIGGEGPFDGQPFAPRVLDGGGDDLYLFTPDAPRFARVRIQPAHSHGALKPQSPHEGRSESQAAQDTLTGDEVGHFAQRRVRGDKADAQPVSAQVHAHLVVGESRTAGEILGMSGDVESGGMEHGLMQRQGHDSGNDPGAQQVAGSGKGDPGGAPA